MLPRRLSSILTACIHLRIIRILLHTSFCVLIVCGHPDKSFSDGLRSAAGVSRVSESMVGTTLLLTP